MVGAFHRFPWHLGLKPRHVRAYMAAVLGGGLILSNVRADAFKTPSIPEDEAATVLRHELAGDNAARQAQLDANLKVNPNDATARWQAGFLRLDRKWVDVDALSPSEKQAKVWQAYTDKREMAPDTVDGQLALANWSRKHRLFLQERAHLQRVIQLSTDHSEARQRLGFVLRGTRWVETQSLWESQQGAQERQAAFQKWAPKIADIAQRLHDRRPKTRQSAQDRLEELDDPDAIPAIESVLAYARESDALLALDAIARFPRLEATRALTRIGICSQSTAIRSAAATLLQSRRRDEFVPALLNELSKPIESTYAAVDINGRIEYRHVFAREQRDQKNIDVRDLTMQPENTEVSSANLPAAAPGTRFRLSATPSQVDYDMSRLRAVDQTTRAMAEREFEKERQNEQIGTLNSRITTLLARSTGQTTNEDPEYWWKWWDQENDVYQTGPKQDRVSYAKAATSYTALRYASYQGSPVPSESSVRHECFVAGTPIWTWEGLKPIEQIRRGDIVVSQHVETGELALQPVIATSLRPADEVLRIETTLDELSASPGHPLWVAGHGWKLAKELAVGDIVHGMRGGYRVLSSNTSAPRETYNLVVDRFHTYFVGEARVLCHDNTEVIATDARFPGVRPEREPLR